MKNNLLPIAQEGWNSIGYILVLSFVLFLLSFNGLAFLVLILGLSLVYLFRNPERELPSFENNCVVSPVDGTVISIEEVSMPLYSTKIVIKSSYLDVAILRLPMTSKVISLRQEKGTRVSLNNELGNKLNENTSLVFENEHGNKICVKHIVQESFLGVKINIQENKEALLASRYGFVINAYTEIYLPNNFRTNLNIATKVKASQTLVGYFSK